MRGRRAKLIEGLDKHDFDKLARSVGSASERRRFLAFAHIKDGKSFSEWRRGLLLYANIFSRPPS